MLSDALTCSPLLYFAANPHCLALQKVVEVSSTEEGHQHSEYFTGCTVYIPYQQFIKSSRLGYNFRYKVGNYGAITICSF